MKNPRLLAIAAVVIALGHTAMGGAGRATADPESDIVVPASAFSQASLHGAWTLAADAAASEGIKLMAWRPPSSADRVDAVDRVTNAAPDVRREPLADPDDFADVTFEAPARTPYRIWLHLGAQDTGGADSVWLQFSDAELNGSPAYVIDTPSGLLVSARACRGCAMAGWHWADSSWSLGQPSTVQFATGGVHTLRIQPRAPGVQVDQIVLSPRLYMNSAPGGPPDNRAMAHRP